MLIQKGSNNDLLIFRELKQKHESEDEEEMRKVVIVFMPLNLFLSVSPNPSSFGQKSCTQTLYITVKSANTFFKGYRIYSNKGRGAY